MTATTLDMPDTSAPASERPVIFHYFRKADLTRSVVDGTAVESLCGVSAVPNMFHGTERSRSRPQQVCSDCRNRYGQLTRAV